MIPTNQLTTYDKQTWIIWIMFLNIFGVQLVMPKNLQQTLNNGQGQRISKRVTVGNLLMFY